VVKLATQVVDDVRRRVQQDTTGHRGRRGDPLYRIRNILRAGQENLTDRQRARLETAFTARGEHLEVELAWRCAQQVRSCYHQPTHTAGRQVAEKILSSFASCPIPEVARLGRTLKQWSREFLGYFDTDGASNGGTEAIIIWSPAWAVCDVAHGADRVRQRHVIWSMSTTSPTWLACGSRRVGIRSGAGAGRPRGGGADEGTAGAHADDGGGVVDRRRSRLRAGRGGGAVSGVLVLDRTVAEHGAGLCA